MGPQQCGVASCWGAWRRVCESAPQLAAQAELASQRRERVPAACGEGVLRALTPESGSCKAAAGNTIHQSCRVTAVFNSSELTHRSALALCLRLCAQPGLARGDFSPRCGKWLWVSSSF